MITPKTDNFLMYIMIGAIVVGFVNFKNKDIVCLISIIIIDMPTKHLITPILINQYPIANPKPVINNNDASGIKISVGTLLIVKDSCLFIGWVAVFGVLFCIYKNRKD